MYESYFGFSEAPFENNLDLRFLFLNEDNKEVLSALSYFIKTKKAFGIVCGDVGTGKTMIISTFLSKLPRSVKPIIISNPYVNSLELLQFIAKCLKLRISNESVLELTDKVRNVLIKAKDQQKQFVLIVDEAHLLSDQSLEEIRLLSNIETSDQKLLQILLFGQYELSHKLDRPEMRHIRQRINVNRFLSPLNLSETIGYMEHRLKTVGSSFDSCFENNCGKLIFKMTKGVPRHINQLCDNALLICMAQQIKKVNRKIVKMAEDAWQTDRIFTPKSFMGKSRFNHRLVPLTGTVIIILVGGTLLSYSGFLGERAQQIFHRFVPVSWTTADKKISSMFEFSKGGQHLAAQKQTESDYRQSETNPSPPKTSGKDFQKGDRDSSAGITVKVPEDQQPGKSARVSRDGEAPVSTEIPGQEIAKQKSASMAVKPPSENFPGPPREASSPAPDKADETEARLSQNTSPLELPEPTQKLQPAELKSPGTSQPPTQIVAKKGDNLTAIAVKNYPDNGKIGLVGIILANPNIHHDGFIYPGQVLELPKINFTDNTIQLKDNRFYFPYGRYYSPKDLINDSAWLTKVKVKYLVLPSKDRQGKTFNRVFLGGYEKVDELKEAVKRTGKK